MTERFLEFAKAELDKVHAQGLLKEEWPLLGPQGATIRVQGRAEPVLNFCANNYLGLSGHPELVAAAKQALDEWGYGLSSVRFICGTQAPHLELERRMAEFVGGEAAILYAACFDANGGVFEALLGAEDAIIADRLNHASIIDGVRLCKARRLVYENVDMVDLEAKLVEAKDARFRLVVTDGVFSMDGTLAPLPQIVDLARRHDALVMVDDSHATGFMGPGGRGTWEHFGLAPGTIDIVTTTFGKALGGALGGCTVSRAPIVGLLRQRSRPYLFSNSLAPAVVGATIRAIDLVRGSAGLRDRLEGNASLFRQRMTEAGFELKAGEHPIVPVLFSRFAPDDAPLAQAFARELLELGIYVKGFFHPVVPRGQARIRVQLSAAHSPADIERAVSAFTTVGRRLGVVV